MLQSTLQAIKYKGLHQAAGGPYSVGTSHWTKGFPHGWAPTYREEAVGSAPLVETARIPQASEAAGGLRRMVAHCKVNRKCMTPCNERFLLCLRYMNVGNRQDAG